jgi:SAM-dependent methyltransferase
MLLAPLGFNITGIDLTPNMIMRAKQLAASHLSSSAEFFVMDAEHPAFPDGFFDAVISRNLTWTLPHPAEAYREWHRVLKTGGVLLNYDAEYAKGFHKYDQAENCAHQGLDDSLTEECHNIYHMLSVSSLDRPEWDEAILKEIGFTEVTSDLGAGDRLYAEKDRFYMPDRMFCVRAVK